MACKAHRGSSSFIQPQLTSHSWDPARFPLLAELTQTGGSMPVTWLDPGLEVEIGSQDGGGH